MSRPVATDQAAEASAATRRTSAWSTRTCTNAVRHRGELISREDSGGPVAPPRATVGIRLADAEVASAVGEEPASVATATAAGDGMVDSAGGAIRHADDRDGAPVVSFQVTAVPAGHDAPGEFTVTNEVEDGQRRTGRPGSTCIVEASARSKATRSTDRVGWSTAAPSSRPDRLGAPTTTSAPRRSGTDQEAAP